MVTRHMGSALVLALVAACSGNSVVGESGAGAPSGGGGEGSSGAPSLPPDTVEPGGTGPAYPGTGFRVHEWGTNTIVVGTDGALQRGLQHEEEDLPGFVYDRRHTEQVAGDAGSVSAKMETPVTYFYSDKPLTVQASVRYPKGVLTQWYPRVQSFYPPVYSGKGDPALDRAYPFTSAVCREILSRVGDGVLSWGTVEVLPRDAAPTLPEAALSRYTWSHARAVAANTLRVSDKAGGSQDERFLFYRGLGEAPFAVKVMAQPGAAGDDGGLALHNENPRERVGAVFVLRVEADKAAFVVKPAGIAPSTTLTETAPPATQPLEAYANDLAKAMVVELDRAGLYHDESVAMVKTWARQWFRTPGVRVLYLSPRTLVDEQIPLELTPKPEELVRVMVIRVEALTRKQEVLDLAMTTKLGGDASAKAEGEAYFKSLGRFAEPRLRRALAQSPEAPLPATQLLDRIATADTRTRAGE